MALPSVPSPPTSAAGDNVINRNASITFSSTTTARARRLQLRNAGFRGAAVPTRKVTPKSSTTSTWSSLASGHYSPDRENKSPSESKHSMSLSGSRRQSHGVLQEISNSSIRRPKQTLITTDTAPITNDYDASFAEYFSSPPMVSATPSVRLKSVKIRKKVPPRRSVSGETRKYVEHLETELVAAQSQLAKVDSPTSTRQQTARMRSLSAEARRLELEVAEWEAKYEERIREAVDRHGLIEDELRARLRTLEESNEEAVFQSRELEAALEIARRNFEAVDAANAQLEKRLEIMSDLLASTPHIDIYAQTPGRRPLNPRPHSMFPRIPIAGVLPISPDRTSWTMPPSPMSASTQVRRSQQNHVARPSTADSAQYEHSRTLAGFNSLLAATCVPDAATIAGAAFNEEDAVTPVQQVEAIPGMILQGSRLKSAKRMRRFGAGSFGPKPLILSSAPHCDFVPASAPLPDHDENVLMPSGTLDSYARELGSPVLPTRRSRSLAEVEVGAISPGSPVLEGALLFNSSHESMSVCRTEASQETKIHRLPSMLSGKGCNLLEELSRAQPIEGDSFLDSYVDDVSAADKASNISAQDAIDTSNTVESRSCAIALINDRSGSVRSSEFETCDANDIDIAYGSEESDLPLGRTCGGSIIRINTTSLSTLDRLRLLLRDYWRRRLDLAQHLVQTAQSRIRIPEALRNVQWWLVGILLGPMAKQRLLSESHGASGQCRTSTPPKPPEEPGHGALNHTPSRTVDRIAGQGKKRTPRGRRVCSHDIAKHSPWLWLRFSLTLAFAIGTAFTAGPGTLLKPRNRECRQRSGSSSKRAKSSDSASTA